MRVLILGDSLSFPRPKRGQPLEVTWPVLLKARYPSVDFWLRAHPRSCLWDVLRELGFFSESLTAFDALIIQCGIVDCARRPYPFWLYKVLEQSLSMERFRRLERFAHRKLLWVYGRPWLSRRKFAAALRELIRQVDSAAPKLPVIFVPIAPPTRAALVNLPGIAQAAADYNQILRQTTEELAAGFPCVTVQPFSGVDPLFTTIEDGHHLSIEGHGLIASALGEKIETLLTAAAAAH